MYVSICSIKDMDVSAVTHRPDGDSNLALISWRLRKHLFSELFFQSVKIFFQSLDLCASMRASFVRSCLLGPSNFEKGAWMGMANKCQQYWHHSPPNRPNRQIKAKCKDLQMMQSCIELLRLNLCRYFFAGQHLS